jgi:hypothetical protein
MMESSLSIAALHKDMLRDFYGSESEEDDLLLSEEESELLDEFLRFFFFLSFLSAFEVTLLVLLTLLTFELVSFSSSENPGFFLKAAD